ncbi:Replication factor C subunit 5 [Dictyocoela muelleri]|nr:Replication factor C subunit 5 [Dictyocoela muelleri]
MLWIEKYRPQTFQELKNRQEIVKDLSLYSLETIPHLIIYGAPGYGKRTILMALIRHLYGKISETFVREANIENKLTIKFVETREYIEINPAEYGNFDRIVIQNLIKDIAQTRPILSLVGSEQTLKLIVVSEAEKLSKDAQSALRRTVETYSPNFRIVLLSTDLSKIIEPLKSRCFCLRIPMIDGKSILKEIMEIEDFLIPESELEAILEASSGNLRKAICSLETLWNSKNDKVIKKIKFSSPYLLEWEKTIQKIGDQILKNRTTQAIIDIRKDVYSLLTSCIAPNLILTRIFKFIVQKIPYEKRIIITKLALRYNERIVKGTKSIFHIEAFVVSVMNELNKTGSGNL